MLETTSFQHLQNPRTTLYLIPALGCLGNLPSSVIHTSKNPLFSSLPQLNYFRPDARLGVSRRAFKAFGSKAVQNRTLNTSSSKNQGQTCDSPQLLHNLSTRGKLTFARHVDSLHTRGKLLFAKKDHPKAQPQKYLDTKISN